MKGQRKGGRAPAEKAENVLATIGKLEPILVENVVLPSLAGDGTELPDAPPEPVYDREARDDIQGNIIPGFNKDHQHFFFYRIRSTAQTKNWLRLITPAISSMDDVLAFVRRDVRARSSVPNSVS
jgi:hypothetical protein